MASIHPAGDSYNHRPSDLHDVCHPTGNFILSSSCVVCLVVRSRGSREKDSEKVSTYAWWYSYLRDCLSLNSQEIIHKFILLEVLLKPGSSYSFGGTQSPAALIAGVIQNSQVVYTHVGPKYQIRAILRKSLLSCLPVELFVGRCVKRVELHPICLPVGLSVSVSYGPLRMVFRYGIGINWG